MNAKLIQPLGETEEHLCFVAKRDIEAGDELLFEYGDRRRNVCNQNQWLRH
jgi:SET domain-containing protein